MFEHGPEFDAVALLETRYIDMKIAHQLLYDIRDHFVFASQRITSVHGKLAGVDGAVAIAQGFGILRIGPAYFALMRLKPRSARR